MSLAKIKEAASRRDFEAACAALDEQCRIYESVLRGAFTEDQKHTAECQLGESAAYLITYFFDVPIRAALSNEDEDEAACKLARMKLYCDQLAMQTPTLRVTSRLSLSEAYDAVYPFSERQMSIISSILRFNTEG